MDRMDWFIVGGALIILIGSKLLSRWVPPHWWYVSPRKRRAMLLAVREFSAEHRNSKMDSEGSWIYQTDREKCFVFVQQHLPMLHPPQYAGYVVWHDREKIDRLGGLQFHWGIEPQHAVEEYEACRNAGKT